MDYYNESCMNAIDTAFKNIKGSILEQDNKINDIKKEIEQIKKDVKKINSILYNKVEW